MSCRTRGRISVRPYEQTRKRTCKRTSIRGQTLTARALPGPGTLTPRALNPFTSSSEAKGYIFPHKRTDGNSPVFYRISSPLGPPTDHLMSPKGQPTALLCWLKADRLMAVFFPSPLYTNDDYDDNNDIIHHS